MSLRNGAGVPGLASGNSKKLIGLSSEDSRGSCGAFASWNELKRVSKRVGLGRRDRRYHADVVAVEENLGELGLVALIVAVGAC